jgi:hypothetical protein
MSSDTKSNAPGSGPTYRSGPASGKSSRSDGPGPASPPRSDYWSGKADKDRKADPTNKDSPDYDRALDPSVSDDDLTDPEYLRRQGERAKAAIMGAAGAVKAQAVGGAKGLVAGFKGSDDGAGGSGSGNGSGGAGVKDKAMGVVREHPWYTLGGATAAGFLGALYLNPSRFGRLRSRIKNLEARLDKQEKVARAGGSHDAVATQEAAKSKATKTSLWTSLGTMAMGEAMRSLKPFLTDRIAPLMAGMGGMGGQHQGAGGPYGHPGDLSPEMMAALRERFGGFPPEAGRASGGMPPGYGRPADPDAMPPGAMPPGTAGGQKPPRSAGDPSI